VFWPARADPAGRRCELSSKRVIRNRHTCSSCISSNEDVARTLVRHSDKYSWPKENLVRSLGLIQAGLSLRSSPGGSRRFVEGYPCDTCAGSVNDRDEECLIELI
jgi:hypothetical protein